MEAPKVTISRARAMRRRMSPPEARLWLAVRRGAVQGLRFRRQHPTGPFILDFYCDSARLAVEIGGKGHVLRAEADARRDAWLSARGIRTLRIPARKVRANLHGVLAVIASAAG